MEGIGRINIRVRMSARWLGRDKLVWYNSDITNHVQKLVVMLEKEQKDEGAAAMIYIHHDHSVREDPVRFTDVKLESPPPLYPCDLSPQSSTAALGPTVCCVGGDLSKSIGYSQFADADGCPKWDVSPSLLTPRRHPKLLAVRDYLFIVGGKQLKQKEELDPPMEVFIPSRSTSTCFPVKQPDFKIDDSGLVLLPCLGEPEEEFIIVMSHSDCILYSYYIQENDWYTYNDVGDKVYEHIKNIYGDPVAVAQENAFYWFNLCSGKVARLCCYNWKTDQLLQGSIVGLQHEDSFISFTRSTKILLHLFDNFFCLVWYDSPRPPTHYKCTYLHFTILRVSKNVPVGSLTASVVGCLRHSLPCDLFLQGAYVSVENGKQECQPELKM